MERPVRTARDPGGDSRTNAIAGGAIAGFIGGVAIIAWMGIITAAQGGDLWAPLKMAAFPFLGDRALLPGFDPVALFASTIVHFLVSVGWGVLFGIATYGLSRPVTLLASVPFGIVVWLVMFYIVLPLVGARELLAMVSPALAAAEHLVFGLFTAIGFLPFQREVVLRAPAPEPGREPGPAPAGPAPAV